MLDAPATGMEQGQQLTGALGGASRTWQTAQQPTAAGLRARNEGRPEATAVRSGPRLSPTVGPAFRQNPGVEVAGIEPASFDASPGLLRAQSALPLLGPIDHADKSM